MTMITVLAYWSLVIGIWSFWFHSSFPLVIGHWDLVIFHSSAPFRTGDFCAGASSAATTAISFGGCVRFSALHRLTDGIAKGNDAIANRCGPLEFERFGSREHFGFQLLDILFRDIDGVARTSNG